MSLDTADGKSAVDQRHRLEFSRLSTEETMKACTCALSLVMLISACGRPERQRVSSRRAGRSLAHLRCADDLLADGGRIPSCKDADGVTPAGAFTRRIVSSLEHGGTHIDAPIHFAQGHQAVDAIPLNRLIGSALVIDVTAQSDANADYQVTTEDSARFEREHGAIPTMRSCPFGLASRNDGRMRRGIWERRRG